MADHYISGNRGMDVLQSKNFTTGTSSTAGDVFEFRILDGASVKKIEVDMFLEALQHWFQDASLVKASGFDVT